MRVAPTCQPGYPCAMTNTPTSDARLDALEIRIAHQDATIEELNSAVTDQWKLIDQLKRQIARLNDRVEATEAAANAAPAAHKPPPHY